MGKRKPTAEEMAARLFRLGQLVSGIESARLALSVAQRSRDLLSEDDDELLHTAFEILGGIEQRIWQLINKKPSG